jgi:hypothetical protein
MTYLFSRKLESPGHANQIIGHSGERTWNEIEKQFCGKKESFERRVSGRIEHTPSRTSDILRPSARCSKQASNSSFGIAHCLIEFSWES